MPIRFSNGKAYVAGERYRADVSMEAMSRMWRHSLLFPSGIRLWNWIRDPGFNGLIKMD